MKPCLGVIFLLVAGVAASPGQVSESSPATVNHDPALSGGLRVFTVGHSFHFWIGSLIADLAASSGIHGHKTDTMALGGSRVLDCWNIPNAPQTKQPETNTAQAALTKGSVDVLTLSPIWMPDEGIDRFVKLGIAHNPNLRVTVQEFWLPNDEYAPKYPLQVRKQPPPDHDAADLAALRVAQDAYDRDVETYVAALNKELGREVIAIVPVGDATIALREKIRAGEAPGISRESELFTDPWGHPTAFLKVLSAYCHYAVLYGRSPVGLPAPAVRGAKPIGEALNRLLQEIAWDAVRKCPMSGVETGGGNS